MKLKPYKNIDEYIKNFPISTQAIIEKIRAMAREYMPSYATEAIKYGIPTIQVSGKNAFHFAGYETHIGLYPASDEAVELIPELKDYRTGKGTFQFKLNKPIPYELIEKYISFLTKNAT